MIPRITTHSSPVGEFISIDPCRLLPEEVGEFMARLEAAKAQCMSLSHERTRRVSLDGQYEATGIGWLRPKD